MRSQRVGHESAAFTSTVEVVGSGVGQMCFEGLIPSTSWVTLATQFLYEREVFLSIQWECWYKLYMKCLSEPVKLTLSLSLVAKSCPTLATPRAVACQALLSMGFSRQEDWSGFPFPSPTNTSRNQMATEGEGRQITHKPVLFHSPWDTFKYTLRVSTL